MSDSRTDAPHGQWDAIVVGAGIGGLSAAAYLAAAGRKTLVLEQHTVIGGSSHVFRRRGRWEFDVGVHYLGDCGPGGQVSRVLNGLGLEDRMEFVEMDRDGFDTVVAPDMEIKIPCDWDQLMDNFIAEFPDEEKAIRRYFGVLRAIGGGIDHSVSCSSRRNQLRAMRKVGRKSPWMYAPHAALIGASGISPRIALLVSLYSGAYAAPATVASVGMHAGYMHAYIDGGSWFPKGGGQAMPAAFADVVTSHGGEIRTGVTVGEILVENGRVAGVRTDDGEELRSAVVVSDIDIKKTYRDLVGYDHLPWWVARRIRGYKMSQPYFTAYFGLEMDLRSSPNTNYYVMPSWDGTENTRSLLKVLPDLVTKAHRRDPLEWAHDYARRQISMVHSGTTRDPENTRTAPPGCGVVESLSIAPPEPSVWGLDQESIDDGSYRKNPLYLEIKDILTEGMLDRVERAIPGARASVAWSESSSPATQERYTNTHAGIGLEPRVSQWGMLRPGVRTAIPGLFLAGTSTTWGPGVTGSMLSGMHAAGAILDRDLDTEVRNGVVLADTRRLRPIGDTADPLWLSSRPERFTTARAERAADGERVSATSPAGVADGDPRESAV
ncbi:phytoene desaturase family protein [Gordonia soli]|uniref:Putative oxidoreductase n=1 Tax=Gordonia soli NBRC 108243 TaxID=1223545 RepID=M0QH67_9ACTN|nr:NAD(P)/FAD-dependent oxidoreductase [Gordonia soli]GAC67868.1 putative oxidoreductase [Gordonia soli NBRC 108243]